ncbi:MULTISPECIES: iron ABC transporter permease [unclassified Staphylococcus]|uniref:FecCD family ABC transporter permease n=1 Tax=unclassified Staphylococcus TaxID=91994 RepID=UPI0021CF0FE8|nr:MULTISPECIES: iron ABC transporter permease [unclassified Staphylococcus]UXR78634.1 iron ABC transporter permease [Staphylococcus sp. IVB6227]UXR82793.1 iron ABC transporter permease [Staphylococcus sp. IVB6214]
MSNCKWKGFITLSLWSLFLIGIISYALFSQLDWHHTLTSTLIWQVRLPRVLLALFAGMGLTIAGQMYQLILNNPLADSFTLGLANGATLGAAIAIFSGLTFVWVAPFAILFGILTLILVMTVAQLLSSGYPTRSLILSGILLGSLLNAALYLLVQLNPTRLQNILGYLFGGFSSAEYREVVYVFVTLIVVCVCLFLLTPQIKLLQLDVHTSTSLGLNVQRLSLTVLMCATILATVIIGYVGVIGFIGMVVPQFIQRTIRSGLLYKMVMNLIVGGSVMVLADVLGAQLLAPIQLPASIVLALLGIPLMFYLMIVEGRRVID